MNSTGIENLWRPQGWEAQVGGVQARWALPGLVNAHSHAFQRAMAGLAERQTHPAAGLGPREPHEDSFWTWRETMYRFAARITPETQQAVAAQLYAELLEQGYTQVCEFHYLHHAPDGRPYANRCAMSRALIAAARETGIRLTLLPTLYTTGGFDGRPLGERQRRFGHTVEEFLRLLEALRAEQDDALRIGLAFHSLRAVPEAAMREVLAALPGDTTLHIHIAEQIGEVQDCLAIRNARPVEWLLANMPVDARWTLVHATHMTPEEIRDVAASGATVAICPTTEGNLGDGLFPLREYLAAGGRFGIGSDSHISTSPVEELRWLEYGQRLALHRRNIAAGASGGSTGEALFAQALAGGARSAGRDVDAGDVVVLDEDAPQLAGATRENLLDHWIFSGNRSLVREAWIGGRRVVERGRHVDGERIAARYRVALAQLLA